jgi:hypothetical protein
MEANQLFNLSPSQLRRAAELKERIDELNGELAGILGSVGVSAIGASNGRAGGKRRMSAEGRRRIGEAARARWAKIHAAQGQRPNVSVSTSAPSGGKRRTMSAAARKKIADAQKARWAKIRAAKKA